MSLKPDLDLIARRIKAAQDHGSQIDPITSEFSDFDLEQAYEVLHRIHQARLSEGIAPVGRKIGFTNPNIWPEYGVNAPIWGYLYDDKVIQAFDQDLSFSLAGLTEPKVEPEVVLHFSKTPSNDDPAAILECVDWVAHGMEIVQSHYPGWKFRIGDTVADSALHAALLLGEAVPVGELGSDPLEVLESFTVTLLRDGEELETGGGANVLGSPVSSVAHLMQTLAGQPQYAPLKAGEIVTTGTITSAFPAVPGETFSTKFSGIPLPGLSVTFEA